MDGLKTLNLSLSPCAHRRYPMSPGHLVLAGLIGCDGRDVELLHANLRIFIHYTLILECSKDASGTVSLVGLKLPGR